MKWEDPERWVSLALLVPGVAGCSVRLTRELWDSAVHLACMYIFCNEIHDLALYLLVFHNESFPLLCVYDVDVLWK